MKSATPVAGAALVLVSLLVPSCGGTKLASAWHDGDVDEQGRITNWSGALHRVADGTLTVGVLNDAQRIHLYLRPETPSAALSLYAAGFTIWFSNGGERTGVRFPREDPSSLTREIGEGHARKREDADFGRGPQLPSVEPKFTVVDVLGSDGTPLHGGRIGDVGGVQIAMSEGGGLSYVQVSLDLAPPSGNNVGVGAEPGDEVTIGLTTPEIDFRELMPQMRGRQGNGPGGGEGRPFPGGEGGGPPGGGRRGGPGGMSGRGGGGPRGGPPSLPEPFGVTAKVTLARPVDRGSR